MSGSSRDGIAGDRKPPMPRPVQPGRSVSGTPQTRPPSNTHSLLPSRSAGSMRGGAPKMVFRPVRPPRREIKPDPDGPEAAAAAAATSSAASSANFNSAGPSRPFAPPPKRPYQREPIVMTASGPFAMGAMASGNAGKTRNTPINIPMSRPKQEFSIDVDSSHRLNYREPDKVDRKEREEYSDPESPGVEIIDMEDISQLDAMAPTSLPRMKAKEKKKKKKVEDAVRVKKEKSPLRENGVDIEDGNIELEEVEKDEEMGNADALDLSASEDEEIMDNLMEDFIGDQDDEASNPENRLYLFQFPLLFPEFIPSETATQQTLTKKRSVAFAEGTKGPTNGSASIGKSVSTAVPPAKKEENEADSQEEPASKLHEGQIGRLDVYADGRVNFRFNDIVMELTGGSQSSFLQQIMILDGEQQKATTLGELHRKFVVSPEIESMLNDVDIAQ